MTQPLEKISKYLQMKKGRRRDQGLYRRRRQIRKAAQLLRDIALTLDSDELLNLMPPDTFILFHEAFLKLFQKHPIYLELYPLRLREEWTRRFPNLMKFARRQEMEMEYYQKVTSHPIYGTIITSPDEYMKIQNVLYSILWMPQRFFYTLNVLLVMPMDKFDELAEEVLRTRKKEPYPKWFERARTIEFKKRVRDLLDSFEAWTIGVEVREKQYEIDVDEILSVIKQMDKAAEIVQPHDEHLEGVLTLVSQMLRAFITRYVTSQENDLEA